MMERLRAVYTRGGLLNDAEATAAHIHCGCAVRCWANETADRIPPPSPLSRAQAYRPWIGTHFEATRLLIVGENFHAHGGWDEAERLVRWCIPALTNGRRRMNFDNPHYVGSLFQHRAALYVGIWLDALGHGPIPIGEIYEHVAFTNAVKCSPRATPSVRSSPNPVMWAECPRHVLAGEVAALGARRILVLGTSWNAGAVRAHVWPGLKLVSEAKKVALWRDGEGREALVVPHPSSRGGAARVFAEHVHAVVGSPPEGRSA